MFRDGAERLLVFRVGSERFGVALSAVREVVDSPEARRLPDTPQSLLGVATVRGELVPLYDAREILDVEKGSAVSGAALVFLAAPRCVALAIDDVFDPMLVEAHELRSMPGAADAMIRGLVRRGGDLVVVVDADALVDSMLATVSESEAI
jgi:purine-binding chemotaxis protein CheW